jgi:hypothetical protein
MHGCRSSSRRGDFRSRTRSWAVMHAARVADRVGGSRS